MSGDFAPPPGPSEGPTPSGGQPTPLPTRRPADAHSGTPARSALRGTRGVRTAAWVAIGAGVALLVGISWSAALAWSDSGTQSAEVGETGSLHPLAVVPGMCLEDVGDDGAISSTNVVPCDEPHGAEIFTSRAFSIAKYPGDSEVRREALALCGTRIEGLLPEGGSWVAWAPSEDSWARGDRGVMCVAIFDEPVSEPLSPAGIAALEDDADSKDDGQDA